MKKIKLGFAPTRRSIFSAPDAVKYRGLTAQRLKELGVDFVDITDINEEGLLYDDKDVDKIVEKFKKEGVDGLMLPHCNFGTEYVCARLAKKLDVPVLLWGPLDERPEPNGVRLRDTQCGLFATGKVLRRFQIPFTYLTNCRLNDPVFERGVKDFLAVCNVVKTFKNIRILQISTRPFDFWTTMCNEGELLEKFNIQLAPVPMTELTEEVKQFVKTKKNGADDRLHQGYHGYQDQRRGSRNGSSSGSGNEESGREIWMSGSCDPVLECASDRNRNYAMCSKCDSQ